MSKRTLPTVTGGPDALGASTIMDPGLAARHGVDYVHIAAIAIDVDRVRELVDDLEDLEGPHELPFGWEIFLTEVHLLQALDPATVEADRALIEDACLSIVEGGPVPAGAQGPLGAQLAFAVFDAVNRGVWPESLRAPFHGWGSKAPPFVGRLRSLWEDAPEKLASELAATCLDAPLDPPLAPPTTAALEAMLLDTE